MVEKNLRRLIRKSFGGGTAALEHGISGYRAMWLICVFDLPVGSKTERRNATRFRHLLLDEGFSMKQWSVYQRYYESRDQAEAASFRIGAKAPSMGKVTMYFITDKQFAMVRNYEGPVRAESDEKPSQLALF